ncbi:uncharacterized protein ACLA_092140 [Aspergillus clavatus NRRL 1]|uniref:Uncharacterized protein n=1 Tax=Aspergillus clavatus (strain ATCC 1007 / CBS 513.65 / DSM 816 / NCTC 3887 / NRRL 1 / QM 1276 / 107) TaxID=344612 RepID=A1CF67_ASPCL|nr:uncharacterized protein ACLA_092140 [Aspergillus clavatus NRRL 1]EAW11516.1 conserved hypothetical protein [Aspergillus clavatus NRRL 1]
MDHFIWGAFLALSNLGGMYVKVPYTVVTPSHTPLDRFMGSFQLTTAVRSTFYAARSMHYRVFPEAEDLATSQQNATLGLDEMLKQVMEQYAHERNLTGRCLSGVGNSGSIQLPPSVRIHHRLFGRDFDLELGHDSAEMMWAVWTTVLLVWISFLLIVSWCIDYHRRRGARPSAPDRTVGHSSNHLTKNDVVDLLRFSRLSIAQEIKDDMSHDIEFIIERIGDILESLRHFEGTLTPEGPEEDSKEADDEIVCEKNLAKTFNEHLQFCSGATNSILEMLDQMKKRIDRKIKLQSILPGSNGAENGTIDNPGAQLAHYLSGSMIKDDASTSASALEKRIIEELERWLRENLAGDVLKPTQAIDEGIQRRISDAETALAQIQQKIDTSFAGKDQLDETLNSFQEDIDSLRTSLSSFYQQGTGVQIEDIENIVNAQVQTLNERLQSIDKPAPMTLEEKETITNDINNLRETLYDLKKLCGLLKSKLDSAVTEDQLNEILKEKNEFLAKHIEQLGDEVTRLRKKYNTIQNIVDASGIDDMPLAENLEHIRIALENSTKNHQAMQQELNSHAIKHAALRENVQSQKVELQGTIDKRITNVTRNIMELQNVFPRVKQLEGQMIMQQRTNRETWSYLDQCMDTLGIKYGLGRAHLPSSPTTDQAQKHTSMRIKEGGNATPKAESLEGGGAQAEGPETAVAEAKNQEAEAPDAEGAEDGAIKAEIQEAKVQGAEAATAEGLGAETRDTKDPGDEVPTDNVAKKEAAGAAIRENEVLNDEAAKQDIRKDETLEDVANPTGTAPQPESPSSAAFDGTEGAAPQPPTEPLSPRSKEVPVIDESSEKDPLAEGPSQPKSPISGGLRGSRWAASESSRKDSLTGIPSQPQTPKTPTSAGLEGSRWAVPEARKKSLTEASSQPQTPVSGGLEGSRWATSEPKRKSLTETPSLPKTLVSGGIASQWPAPEPRKDSLTGQPRKPSSGGLEGSRWAAPESSRKDSLTGIPSQPQTPKTPTSGGLEGSRWATAEPEPQSSRRQNNNRGRRGRKGSRNNNLGETF